MKSTTILPHQRAAYESLLEVGSACFAMARQELGILPRTNTLLVGPTGSGKTFLAQKVAAELGVPFYGLSISDWMPLGTTHRGAAQTWPSICNFLIRNHDQTGVVIFVDELCKLGTSSWDTYVKVELFRLLDLSISTDLLDEFEEKFSDEDRANALDVLRNRAYLIGGGAFQDIWESAGPSIGFSGTSHPPELSLGRLARMLPRELVNRFRSSVITLPFLDIADYSAMLENSIGTIPAYLRNRFGQLGRERIVEASRQQQGVRFLEELMLDTIIAERRVMRTNRDEQLSLGLTVAPRADQHFGWSQPPDDADHVTK